MNIENNDFSYLLRLDRIKIKGVSKIIRIPGLDVESYANIGKLYRVVYSFQNKSGTVVVGFTSKESNFKSIYSIDIYDATMKPFYGMVLKPDTTPKDVNNFLMKLTPNAKLKIKKSLMSNIFRDSDTSILKEGLPPDAMMALMMTALSLILPLLLIVELIIFKIKEHKKWKEERYAERQLEVKINNELFKGQTGHEPAFDIYSKLTRYVNYIADKKATSLIIYGPPGMSKTYNVRRVLHFKKLLPFEDYVIVKGSSLGLSETYDLLYRYKDKIIILDDFDTPLKNEDMVSLLKAATDSYSIRILSLPREKKITSNSQQGGEIGVTPDKFQFSGRIVIITNLELKDIDKSLLSRAPAIEANFQIDDVLKSIKLMLEFINPDIPMEIKKEVYDYVTKLYMADPEHVNIDFRGFKACVEARYAVPEGWDDMIKLIINYTK